MTRKKCSNGGFTLVELLVVILTGSVITLAATTILLLGLRVNHQSGEMLTRQNTTRILLSALEDVIAEGTVTDITAGPESWTVSGEVISREDDVETRELLFSYSSADCAIYTGGTAVTTIIGEKTNTSYTGRTVILEDVLASHIAWDDTGKLITISVETEDGSYTASTYCRTGKLVDENAKDDDGMVKAIIDGTAPFDTLDSDRLEFLQTLASQYKMADGGVNPGLILDEDGNSIGKFYAQWYSSEWPADTAWCACYISWALVKTGAIEKSVATNNWFATVESFKAYIEREEGWKETTTENSVIVPQGGDLIFFDWDGDGKPQHVGVVLTVTSDEDMKYVYTIEGNSANRVAVRKYALGDKQIDGYGDFDDLFKNHLPENADSEQ